MTKRPIQRKKSKQINFEKDKIKMRVCFYLRFFAFKRINKKADFKEKKYGFGGRKKRSKYNTAESYNEGYDTKKDKFKGGKGGAPSKFSKGKQFSGGANKFSNKNKPNKGGLRGGKNKKKF